MPIWTKFNVLAADMPNGVHKMGADSLKVALTNTAPTPADDTLSDIAQIGSAGGYAPATVTVSSSAQSGGTYSLQVAAITWTATGADFEPFRYLVLYNDTTADDRLIAYIDYGTSYTLPSGQPFTHQAGTIMTLSNA